MNVALALLMLGMATVMPHPHPTSPFIDDSRAERRSTGGDRKTAIRVARVLLAEPLALQLTRVRCEAYHGQRYCGLTLSGVKFKHRVDTAAFQGLVAGLVHDAFAVDSTIAEVDLWVTVPADAGKGAIVSGDFAQPTSATVFALTVPRALAAHPDAQANTFWDPTFRAELAHGSAG